MQKVRSMGLKVNIEAWQELKHKKYLTTLDVAKIFSVSYQTIHSYIIKGILVTQTIKRQEFSFVLFSASYIKKIVTGEILVVLPWRKKKIHGVEPIEED